jgi:hypothetical protein
VVRTRSDKSKSLPERNLCSVINLREMVTIMIVVNPRQKGLLKRIGAIFVISSFFEMPRQAAKKRTLGGL